MRSERFARIVLFERLAWTMHRLSQGLIGSLGFDRVRFLTVKSSLNGKRTVAVAC